MKQHYLYLFLLMGLLTSSCEEDYVLEKGDFVPKVVVNAVFTENEAFKVNLSYSRDILTQNHDISYVENAQVMIKEIATGRVESLKYTGNGNYTFIYFTAKADHTYELQVNVPGYNLITATSKVPVKVSSINVFTENIMYNEKQVLEIKFNIKDKNPGFYVWNWILSNNKNPIDSNLFGSPGKLISSVNKFRNINLTGFEENLNHGIKEGEGEFRKTIILAEDSENDGPDDNTAQDEKYYLRIMSLSKEMYDFYVSMEKYVDENSQISSISYLPKVYTNINNGLGLFAGYSQRFIEVKK